MERILGKDLSIFKATSVSLGQAKNENSRGIKSRFVAITLKDCRSIGARPVGHTMFEDEIGTEAFEELMACRLIGQDNKPVLDQYNGYVVNTSLVAERCAERIKKDAELKAMLGDTDKAEDPLMLNRLLRWEGGMTLPYVFPTGPRYANDSNGNLVKDKDNNNVVKTKIDVFCQVADLVIKEDGTRDYNFITGLDPYSRGERLMRTFYKNPATQAAVAPGQVAPEAAPEQPANTTTPEGPGF